MQKLVNLEARNKLKKGIDILANAVKVTLGPKGNNVIIEKTYGPPHITKDGVSVAKEIELEDPFENIGAQLIKTIASKTCDDAGDGTTTSIVLAQAIIEEGIKNLAAGASSVDLKKGIDIAVNKVVQFIKDSAIKIDGDKIRQIATISANNDSEIGNLIADAFEKVSSKGVITIEESKTADTTIKIVEGMQINRGYVSPYFVTDSEECVLEDALILMYDSKLTNLTDCIHLLDYSLSRAKPLLIIANEIDSEVISTLVMNKIKNGFKICVIKSPSFGDEQSDMLQDIAITTGGTVISEKFGNSIKTANESVFGKAEKIIITKDNTTIINGKCNKEQLEYRINYLQNCMDKSTTPNNYKTRIAQLGGGVAVIYVGAASEIEMKEKKDRVEDALCATRAAIEEGVVPGGGTMYIRAIQQLNDLIYRECDINTGINIVLKAITAPLRQIAINAGQEPGVIVSEVLNGDDDWGYNAKSNEFTNLIQDGVIDPAKVTRVALENAASVASLILTAGCVICNKPND